MIKIELPTALANAMGRRVQRKNPEMLSHTLYRVLLILTIIKIDTRWHVYIEL